MTAVLELKHSYEPRGAALLLGNCRDDELLLSGPVGTGKSRAILEKLNGCAIKYPKMRGLMVRQVQRTLADSAIKTFEEFVIPELMEGRGVTYHGPSQRRPGRFEYYNGSEIWFAGMDNADKIMSTEFDMIYVMEATELKADGWDKLTTRLGRRNKMPYQQIVADANPSAPTHWLKLRSDMGSVRMLHSRHSDNPILFNADGTTTEVGALYLARLDKLTGVRRLRLKDGIWAAAEGVIWESFDAAKHVIPRFPIPADWERFWTVDFGMVHPFVLQCWAKDPDGRLFRYREMHMSGRIVEDHAKQILSIVAPDGEWIEPKPRKIICDHDAEDRETLRRHLQLSNHPADKRVKPGLEAVEARFKADRLFFLEGSLVERDKTSVDKLKPTCTEEEIPGYIWDEKKEQPVKEDDDGCDTTRYMVADQDLKSNGDVLRWFE